MKLIAKINQLKSQRQAVILAHNYQPREIQDIADFVGDSLELSLQAIKTKAKVIIFCGVDFMAETAAILNPQKIVLIPDKQACCPMANMITLAKLEKLKKKYPQAKIVCYVNTSAKIKAASDICCTSANGEKVVSSLAAKKIIFVPDRHLGDYLALKCKKDFILFPGFCPTHIKIIPQNIIKLKKEYPRALVLAHPECVRPVRQLADQVLSTGGISHFINQSKVKEFIIATENNLIYRLKKENPQKVFYPASFLAVCPNMKKITLEKILTSLQENQFIVKVPEKIAQKARKTIEKMIALK